MGWPHIAVGVTLHLDTRCLLGSELLHRVGVQLPVPLACTTDGLERWQHNMESWAQGFDW